MTPRGSTVAPIGAMIVALMALDRNSAIALLAVLGSCMIYGDDLLEEADDDDGGTTTTSSQGGGPLGGGGGTTSAMGGMDASTTTSGPSGPGGGGSGGSGGSGGGPGVVLWINEIHYDNVEADVDEGFEIAGTAGTVLGGYSVELMSMGTLYSTIPLSGSLPNQQNGFGTKWFAVPGLQNGPADGLVLIAPGSVVIQFLSYEGTMTATNGTAVGMTSIDIGVTEDAANMTLPQPGYSLQLTGTGGVYSAFSWTGRELATRDAPNVGQSFQ